jgi:hypothetical protein
VSKSVRVPEKSGLAGGTRFSASHTGFRLELEGQQLAFYRAAGEHDAALAGWYLGARVALAIPSNPQGPRASRASRS